MSIAVIQFLLIKNKTYLPLEVIGEYVYLDKLSN